MALKSEKSSDPSPLTPLVVSRVVDCPECHETCGWCSWYRKNAREAGCGCILPSGRHANRCAWGEAAKGVPCTTCDGSGRVTATTTYTRLETAHV